jgi:hypothetical protein
MSLHQFAEKLRQVLTNPHVLVVDGNTIYLYTKDRELISFSV